MTEEVKPLVLLLYPEQQDQATVALGRAFIDAPVFKAIVPEIRDRSQKGALLVAAGLIVGACRRDAPLRGARHEAFLERVGS